LSVADNCRMIVLLNLFVLHSFLLIELFDWHCSAIIGGAYRITRCTFFSLVGSNSYNEFFDGFANCLAREVAYIEVTKKLWGIDRFEQVLNEPLSSTVNSVACSLPFEFMKKGYDCTGGYPNVCSEMIDHSYAKCMLDRAIRILTRDELSLLSFSPNKFLGPSTGPFLVERMYHPLARIKLLCSSQTPESEYRDDLEDEDEDEEEDEDEDIPAAEMVRCPDSSPSEITFRVAC